MFLNRISRGPRISQYMRLNLGSSDSENVKENNLDEIVSFGCVRDLYYI